MNAHFAPCFEIHKMWYCFEIYTILHLFVALQEVAFVLRSARMFVGGQCECFNGGQCEMKLRRLQQALFLPCTVENDKRQLQAQSQSRSTSKSGISSGAFLVVLQLTMDIMLSPRYRTFLSFT